MEHGGAPPPPPLPPQARYRVLRRLGEGAFGEVLDAVDTVTGEAVALKRIFVRDSPRPGCE